MISSQNVYEIRPRKDKRGVDLISDVPPFRRLWYGEPDAVNNAIGYAKFFSRSHDAVIRVCDEAGKVRIASTSRRLLASLSDSDFTSNENARAFNPLFGISRPR